MPINHVTIYNDTNGKVSKVHRCADSVMMHTMDHRLGPYYVTTVMEAVIG